MMWTEYKVVGGRTAPVGRPRKTWSETKRCQVQIVSHTGGLSWAGGEQGGMGVNPHKIARICDWPTQTTQAKYVANFAKVAGYFCSLGPHLKKTIKMFTYDDQTSHGVSTISVLRVCTCHVIRDGTINRG